MFEKLVRTLMDCPDAEYGCSMCKYKNSLGCREKLMSDAANAIEELSGLIDRYGGETGIKNLEEYASKYWDFLKNAPRWIPVTERLPEERADGFSKDVLILVEELDADMVWRDIYTGYYLYDAVSDETGWWAMMTCDCVKIGEHKCGDKIFKCNEKVTHWMPLPEPPKEE